MTKEKAIEINTAVSESRNIYSKLDEIKALKLGNEALKAWKEFRGSGSLMDPMLLPGETKED